MNLPSVTSCDSLDQQTRAMTAALQPWRDAMAADESQHARDAAFITQALGRAPAGLWRVVVRDERAQPVVMATYPLVVAVQGAKKIVRPFPNTLWLVCPQLNHRVSDLERRGRIAQLQAQVHADVDLQAVMQNDHARFASWRWGMLTPRDQQLARDAGWHVALAQRGVGGLTPGSSKIKCLHAYVAYGLAFSKIDAAAGVVGRMAMPD